jgi:hypothetical protein
MTGIFTPAYSVSKRTGSDGPRGRPAGVEPHPAVGLVPTLPGPTSVVLAGRATTVPFTAVLAGPPPDNHGQRHSGLDLRRFLPSQVTKRADLALGAGVKQARTDQS